VKWMDIILILAFLVFLSIGVSLTPLPTPLHPTIETGIKL